MSTAELFLGRLKKLGARERSALRASATRPHDPDAVAHDAFTAAWWPVRNSHLPRDPCRVVAGLYFWHPKDHPRRDTAEDEAGTQEKRKGTNLTTALRAAVDGIRDPKKREQVGKRAEQLVAELLAAPFTGLPDPLWAAVRRLAAAGVAVDWPRLIRDLGRWDRPGGGSSVQDEWATSWALNRRTRHVG